MKTRCFGNGHHHRKLLTAGAVTLALSAPAAALGAEVQPRIVGGQPADDGEYPFMAALMADGAQFCGGSLIAPNWVLTAAHCVENGNADGLQLMLGSNELNGGGQRIDAKRVVVHQDYASQGTPDVALIELTAAAAPPPVGLLEPGTGLENAGQAATVIGWGATSEGGWGTEDLMEVDVPIVDNAVCAQAYEGQINAPLEICAGLAQGGKDSCQGDSGGPLLVRNTGGEFIQAGVVSWGDGCARPGKYGVYARVSAQVDWIAAQTGGSGGGDQPDDGGEPVPIPVPDPSVVAAEFSYACDALNCEFDASASSGGGAPIEAYYWDFGDYQGWNMGRKVNYRYGQEGSYEVYLTIVTADHRIAESVQTVSVNGSGDGDAPDYSGGSGYLSGSGDLAFEPLEPFELREGQVIVGRLSGPADADFDLYLERYAPWSDYWELVRVSESWSSDERIRFKARQSGLYQWVIVSYEGAGEYRFDMETR